MMKTRAMECISPMWASEPKNYTGSANTLTYASLKLYEQLLVIIQTGAWAAGTAAVTLKQATAVAGTGTKALAFSWVWINTAAAPGTFVKTAVTSNTFNLDTPNLMYIIDVFASDLDVDNNFDCVGCNVATPGSNADIYGVIYIGFQPRFPQALPTSMAAD